MKVAVLGASDKPERYSFKAMQMLAQHGHATFPVHPKLRTLLGRPVVASLSDVAESVDTVTVYVSPDKVAALLPELLGLAPRRVIFNPGSEDPASMSALRDAGIHVVEACTLVLLRTQQFDTA